MNNSHYLIWEKSSNNKLENLKYLVGYYYKKTLCTLSLEMFSEWSDETERDMCYVSIKKEVGKEKIELPWDDGPATHESSIYETTKKEFWDEDEALIYVYGLLADLNGLPVFQDALNLVKVSTFVYAVNNMETISFSWRNGKWLIYDSILEKMTTIPSSQLEYLQIINQYLHIRENELT